MTTPVENARADMHSAREKYLALLAQESDLSAVRQVLSTQLDANIYSVSPDAAAAIATYTALQECEMRLASMPHRVEHARHTLEFAVDTYIDALRAPVAPAAAQEFDL